jgi:hypothetical protein
MLYFLEESNKIKSEITPYDADDFKSINDTELSTEQPKPKFRTILGGWLLSWSENNGFSYPFNYHFVFLIMCTITLLLIVAISSFKFLDRGKTKLICEGTIIAYTKKEIELT